MGRKNAKEGFLPEKDDRSMSYPLLSHTLSFPPLPKFINSGLLTRTLNRYPACCLWPQGCLDYHTTDVALQVQDTFSLCLSLWHTHTPSCLLTNHTDSQLHKREVTKSMHKHQQWCSTLVDIKKLNIELNVSLK